MHALFFEVWPKPGHLANYFAHVERLKPALARHAGLWFLDRYRALDDPDLLLSHQHWADDAAIAAWRQDRTHRRSQEAGRRVHFRDYRLRVGAEALRGTSAEAERLMPGGDRLLVTIHAAAVADLPGARGFESVNRPGALLTLAEAGSEEEARGRLAEAGATPGLTAAHAFAISRDYGMLRRDEAPQV